MKIAMPFGILLLAVGCATHVENAGLPGPAAPQPVAHQPAAPNQTATDKRVVMDPALERAIHVVRIKSAASPAGYLRIQLNVENLTDSPKQFNYRIEWVDQYGQDLPLAALSWLPWSLLSHETTMLAGTAPTPAAKDFRVTFSAN